MCIVAQQRRLSSAALQFTCVVCTVVPEPVVQELKVGCYSWVLFFITGEMEYESFGTKAVVRTEMCWEKRIHLVSQDHLQVSYFSSCVFSFIALMFKFHLKITNKVKLHEI